MLLTVPFINFHLDFPFVIQFLHVSSMHLPFLFIFPFVYCCSCIKLNQNILSIPNTSLFKCLFPNFNQSVILITFFFPNESSVLPFMFPGNFSKYTTSGMAKQPEKTRTAILSRPCKPSRIHWVLCWKIRLSWRSYISHIYNCNLISRTRGVNNSHLIEQQ